MGLLPSSDRPWPLSTFTSTLRYSQHLPLSQLPSCETSGPGWWWNGMQAKCVWAFGTSLKKEPWSKQGTTPCDRTMYQFKKSYLIFETRVTLFKHDIGGDTSPVMENGISFCTPFSCAQQSLKEIKIFTMYICDVTSFAGPKAVESYQDVHSIPVETRKMVSRIYCKDCLLRWLIFLSLFNSKMDYM